MKTDAFIIIALLVSILASCTPPESIKPTETIMPVVALTITPNPTSTIAATETPTQQPPPTLSPTPDYSTLGNPPQKINFVYPNWWPINYLSYDDENYFVFSKKLHGTEVIVAIHKDNYQAAVYHEKFAEFVWDTFQLNWEVFQGYPYSKYYVKVLSPKSDQDFVTATAIGFEVITNPQKSNIDKNWYGSPSEYRQLVTHEMFHAWNGGIIMDIGANKNNVRPEYWFLEGATQYYGYRGTPNDIRFYNYRFEDSWQRYIDWIKGPYDIPVVEMRKAEVSTGAWQYGQNVREKGACLFYFLDEELVSMDMSLDDLMQYMYENYGLQEKRYSTDDILIALNTITNGDWSEFFENYVYGTAPLPLDGNFIYLEH